MTDNGYLVCLQLSNRHISKTHLNTFYLTPPDRLLLGVGGPGLSCLSANSQDYKMES